MSFLKTPEQVQDILADSSTKDALEFFKSLSVLEPDIFTSEPVILLEVATAANFEAQTLVVGLNDGDLILVSNETTDGTTLFIKAGCPMELAAEALSATDDSRGLDLSHEALGFLFASVFYTLYLTEN